MDGGPESLAERLGRFFRERGVRPDCPCCGREDWRVVDVPDKTIALGTRPFSRLGEAKRGYMRVDALVCANCGFFRLHSHRVTSGERI